MNADELSPLLDKVKVNVVEMTPRGYRRQKQYNIEATCENSRARVILYQHQDGDWHISFPSGIMGDREALVCMATCIANADALIRPPYVATYEI